MQVIKNERISPFDVDGTLVLHLNPTELSKFKTVEVWDPIHSAFLTVGIHEPNLRLLKEELHRGAQVIVWSAGGNEWAQNVVTALNLDHYDIIVMTKPHTYYDDKDVADWMTRRVYLGPNEVYKSINKGSE
jgi:phosphoserine phosphatase